MKRGYCWHPVLLRLRLHSKGCWRKGWQCTNCKRIYLLTATLRRDRRNE